ncbi:hypothetical protein ACWGQ4_09115 [Streptomyces sp. NPDC055721]|uniref:hypothetical protein n=1 Tax=Streptomyces sp. NPDC127132 TaxID=3345374 RepID=UPI00362CD1BD
MAYVITDAQPDDASTSGPLYLRNRLENYPNAAAGGEPPIRQPDRERYVGAACPERTTKLTR